MSDRKTSKLDNNTKDSIIGHIYRLLERRHKAIPFPLETSDEILVQLVESTIDPHLLAAMHEIQAHPSVGKLLKSTASTKLRIDDTMVTIQFRDTCYLIDGYSIADNIDSKHIPYTIAMDHPHYTELSKWTTDMVTLRNRCGLASNLAYYVVTRCKTAGQIARVWPELVKFLPMQYRDALQSRLRASHMPRGIDMLCVNNDKDEATSVLALLSLIDTTGVNKVKV